MDGPTVFVTMPSLAALMVLGALAIERPPADGVVPIAHLVMLPCVHGETHKPETTPPARISRAAGRVRFASHAGLGRPEVRFGVRR
jgi:hypothetical protein